MSGVAVHTNVSYTLTVDFENGYSFSMQSFDMRVCAEEYCRQMMCNRRFGHYPSEKSEWRYFDDCLDAHYGQRYYSHCLNELGKC